MKMGGGERDIQKMYAQGETRWGGGGGGGEGETERERDVAKTNKIAPQ